MPNNVQEKLQDLSKQFEEVQKRIEERKQLNFQDNILLGELRGRYAVYQEMLENTDTEDAATIKAEPKEKKNGK